MRNKLLLLVFSIVASLIVWNAFDFGSDSNYLVEENLTEEVEFEDPIGEEENESLEEQFVPFMHNISEFNYDQASQLSFRYDFSVLTFSLEPEEFPPC